MKLKFCVDENLSRVVAQCLHQLLSAHKVDHVNDLHLTGVEDAVLFGDLADRGFNAVITRDRRQLVNVKERDALRESGLVWIGLPVSALPGLAGFAADVATIAAVLPGILAAWPVTPTAYTLHRATSKAPNVEQL